MSSKKKVIKSMKDMGITVNQLSRYINLTTDKINDWIKGKIKLPYTHVWKIADFLNLDVDDIV